MSLRLPLSVLLAAACAFACPAGALLDAKELSNQGQLLDNIVAVVNDGVVLQSELNAQVQEIETRLRAQKVALPPEEVMRTQVLDRLILDEIQAQHADHAGIKVSDEQVNGALSDIAQRQRLTLDELPERLAAEGVDYSTYRADLKREIARQMLRQRDVVARIT